MSNSSFYARLKYTCETEGKVPTSPSVLKELGCTQEEMFDLRRSGANPSGDIVLRAAQMLGVSADYFLGLIDTPYPIREGLTHSEHWLIEKTKPLNMNGHAALTAVVNGLVADPNFICY